MMRRILPLLAATAFLSLPAWAQQTTPTIPGAPGAVAGVGPTSLGCAEHLQTVDRWMLKNVHNDDAERGYDEIYRMAADACREGRQQDSLEMVAGLRRMLAMPSNTFEAYDVQTATRPEVARVDAPSDYPTGPGYR